MLKLLRNKIFIGAMCLLLAGALAFILLPRLYSAQSGTTEIVILRQTVEYGAVIISGTERDERGRIVKVHGSHRKVGTISPELLNRLRDNGAPEAELHRLFPEVKDK